MLKRISLIVIFLQIFFAGSAFTQNNNSSSEEEAIKSVIKSEEKNWINGNYEGVANAWAHEKYVISISSGVYSYYENMGWDSISTHFKSNLKDDRSSIFKDLTWTEWNIQTFQDCAWVSYIESFRYKEKLYKSREVKFLERKDNLWKIVYSASVNTTLYDDKNETAEIDLNTAGYSLLNQNRIKDAIDIFKKNVELYPESSNVYDSLGEAYMKNGDKELSIENYKMSLKLDPGNEYAKEMIMKLTDN